jgi:hypothetical protein
VVLPALRSTRRPDKVTIVRWGSIILAVAATIATVAVLVARPPYANPQQLIDELVAEGISCINVRPVDASDKGTPEEQRNELVESLRTAGAPEDLIDDMRFPNEALSCTSGSVQNAIVATYDSNRDAENHIKMMQYLQSGYAVTGDQWIVASGNHGWLLSIQKRLGGDFVTLEPPRDESTQQAPEDPPAETPTPTVDPDAITVVDKIYTPPSTRTERVPVTVGCAYEQRVVGPCQIPETRWDTRYVPVAESYVLLLDDPGQGQRRLQVDASTYGRCGPGDTWPTCRDDG